MSVASAARIEKIVEYRTLLTSERPISFDEFVVLFGPKDDVELIDGVAQQRTEATLAHERLFGFLLCLLGRHTEDHNLGILLGSRTAVRISQFRGRLPDLLFVRQENVSMIEQSGLRFAPDLVIEIISPGDRPSEIVTLETDYRNIGVSEIVFVDQRRRTVQSLRKRLGEEGEELYDAQTLGTNNSLRLDALNGLSLPLTWLFSETRPTVRVALGQWNSTSSVG